MNTRVVLLLGLCLNIVVLPFAWYRLQSARQLSTKSSNATATAAMSLNAAVVDKVPASKYLGTV